MSEKAAAGANENEEGEAEEKEDDGAITAPSWPPPTNLSQPAVSQSHTTTSQDPGSGAATRSPQLWPLPTAVPGPGPVPTELA